jgi:hypothetical protein
MTKIFSVYEVDHRRYTIGTCEACFDNFGAALFFLIESIMLPSYNKKMMIQETVLSTMWPIPIDELVLPVIYYYHQNNGKVVCVP